MKKISFNIETKNYEELIWIHDYLSSVMAYTPTTSNIINMALHEMYMNLKKNESDKTDT